jgi:4a-hydroxytetrahydrobiopterin dehydratase
MVEELLEGHPVELPKGTPVLPQRSVTRLLSLVPGWELGTDKKSIRCRRRTANFMEAIALLNRIAELAEAEQHHPDVRIYGYRNLELVFSTHSIGGLSANDFIMAAKVNQLLA